MMRELADNIMDIAQNSISAGASLTEVHIRISHADDRITFTFKDNPYSTYDRPTHFTPIWYPDGSYTPHTWLLDCWTPAGMLSVNLTDSVRISGDLWEEWHVAPSK